MERLHHYLTHVLFLNATKYLVASVVFPYSVTVFQNWNGLTSECNSSCHTKEAVRNENMHLSHQHGKANFHCHSLVEETATPLHPHYPSSISLFYSTSFLVDIVFAATILCAGIHNLFVPSDLLVKMPSYYSAD